MNWIDIFLCHWVSAYLSDMEDKEWAAVIRESAAINLEARIREIIREEIQKASQ